MLTRGFHRHTLPSHLGFFILVGAVCLYSHLDRVCGYVGVGLL